MSLCTVYVHFDSDIASYLRNLARRFWNQTWKKKKHSVNILLNVQHHGPVKILRLLIIGYIIYAIKKFSFS